MYLDVAARGDQKSVVSGEVQVCHPASVERVHAVFTLPGADFQQGAILGTPELQRTIKNNKQLKFHRDVRLSNLKLMHNAPSCIGYGLKSQNVDHVIDK